MREEAETRPICPECDGRGRIRTEDGTTYRESKCEVCDGAGLVTLDQLRTWRAKQRIGGGGGGDA